MSNIVSLRLRNCKKIFIPSHVTCKKIFNHLYSSIMEQSEQCFKGELNRYNAVIVKSKKEPCELPLFHKQLSASLQEWIKIKRNAVWFEVSDKEADWIPVLVKENFKFHHAKQDKLILYKWLNEQNTCNIPPYAHTNIGVGAFVYNNHTGELLVVKEKCGIHNMWKLPGGYMEPEENINQAVEREVMEETGIRAQFKCILGFRHTHQHAFDCSDIYFVALLSPESFDIKKCSLEISQCVWMKLEEYARHPEVHENNKCMALKLIEHLKTDVGIKAINAVHPISKKPIVVYSIDNIS